jgi:hypothetical protein
MSHTHTGGPLAGLLPRLPMEAPRLNLTGESQTSAARGTVPLTNAVTILGQSVAFDGRTNRSLDLGAARAVLAKDKSVSKTLGFARPPRTAAPSTTASGAADGTSAKAAADVNGTPEGETDASTAAILFDPTTAHKALGAMASSDFAKCTSCLPAEVHGRYNDAVRRYLASGDAPAAAETAEGEPLEHFNSVADLAQREATLYRRKLRDMVLACDHCAANRGKKKRAAAAAAVPGKEATAEEDDSDDELFDLATRHVCTNANALPDCVTDFVAPRLQRRAAKGTTEAVTSVFASASVGGSAAGPSLVAHQPIAAATAQVLTQAVTAPTSVSTVQWLAPGTGGSSGFAVEPANKGAGVLSQLPTALRQGTGLVAPTAPVFEPAVSLAACLKHLPAPGPASELGVDIVAARTNADVVISRSALVDIAMTLAAGGGSSYAAPLRLVPRDGVAGAPVVIVGRPVAATTTPRKQAVAKALKHVARGSAAVWRGGAPHSRAIPKACVEVGLPAVAGISTASVRAVVPIRVDGQTADRRPVVTLVKAEYSAKGYNTVPDALDTYRLEQLSVREVVTALVTLTLMPRAELHVLRVNAYSHALMAVEVHTLGSITRLAKDCAAADAAYDVSGVWAATAVVAGTLKTSAAKGAALDGAFLVKKDGSRDIAVVSGAAVAERVAAEPGLAAASVAKYSGTAPKAEYLPQVNWPRRDRVPFTFPPPANTTTPSGGGDEQGGAATAVVHSLTVVSLADDADSSDLTAPFKLSRPPASAAKRAR